MKQENRCAYNYMQIKLGKELEEKFALGYITVNVIRKNIWWYLDYVRKGKLENAE